MAAVAIFPEAARTADAEFSERERSHWAFQPVRRPDVPVVAAAGRVQTSVDAFVLRRLEEQGLTLAPPATRRELIRRLKLDLLGLPPTPEEIEAFESDERPDAWERLVNQYLASPRYGEAWGRMWLDLVRFAETAGFNADPDRPLAYKYRDYVIRAFNEDRPYDRFLSEQVAGDELYPDSEDALAATGYLRMWPDESNASNILLARQDALNDLTANLGSVVLGLSLGCAQCHDHKFDPLLQTDFYSLQAFFAGIVLEDSVPLGTPEELAAYHARREAWLAETADLRRELHEIESTALAKAAEEKRKKFPPVVLEAIDTHPVERTAFQRQLAFWSERQIDEKLDPKDVLKQMSDAQRQRRDELRKELAELEQRQPGPPRRASVMATVEMQSEPPPTHLLAGGSYEWPIDELQPAFVSILSRESALAAKIEPPRPGTSGRRSALARRLSDPAHPLVARVIVNRLWQGHFGRGLVSNANDLGTQTPPPSHPELLDWLASEFVGVAQPSTLNSQPSAWSLKRLHRAIVLSAVYRQSGQRPSSILDPPSTPATPSIAEPAATPDPENHLLSHFPRRRLSAERIRDSLLAVSGELSQKMYGPGVKPELPPDFSARHAWKPTPDERERNRRSVYIFAKRNLPYPLLEAFDFPDMHEACAQRAETTIAPQALMLLNSELILDAARSLAERVDREAEASTAAALVLRAWQLTFGREPADDELAAAAEFLNQQESLASAQPLVAPEPAERAPADSNDPRRAALVDLCHVLLNANEFLFVE
ncbi:MAG: DUF1549 and DUF1553 domain-containing protein [Planctomycetes bacterium]|nr:DUF1549 and DUF1553 domain-containing protein [Planctomycetota bacterium]